MRIFTTLITTSILMMATSAHAAPVHGVVGDPIGVIITKYSHNNMNIVKHDTANTVNMRRVALAAQQAARDVMGHNS